MKVLKFGAVWCPGCIVMKPRWKEIEAELPWLETEYFDYDSAKDAVATHNITKTLPTFVFLDDEGKELERISGEVSKEEILAIIARSAKPA